MAHLSCYEALALAYAMLKRTKDAHAAAVQVAGLAPAYHFETALPANPEARPEVKERIERLREAAMFSGLPR